MTAKNFSSWMKTAEKVINGRAVRQTIKERAIVLHNKGYSWQEAFEMLGFDTSNWTFHEIVSES